MNYNDLVGPKSTPGSIANYANYGLAPADEVIHDAERLVYQRLRVREMRMGPLPIPLVTGQISAPLPSHFLDPISIHDAFLCPLHMNDPESLLKRRFLVSATGDFASPDFAPLDFSTTATWQQGIPRFVSIFGELLQFDVAANSSMIYWMIYYADLPALGTTPPSTQTNFLTNRYPHILRAAILAAAADFRKDDADYQRCIQRLTGLIQDATAKDDLVNRGIEIDADYSHVSSTRYDGAYY